METPSSIRRITRSQTMSASNNNIPMSRMKEENEEVLSRSRKGKSNRSALFDITNDSPIVGVAMGSLETPSSIDKSSDIAKQTPGTGEALLRGQVKTLLQKVEEDVDLPNLSLDQAPFLRFQGPLSSSAALLAPTPANTPFISNLWSGIAGIEINGFPLISVAKEEDPMLTQATADLRQEALESQEGLVTRALLFDSPGKSEISESSTLSAGLTIQGNCFHEKADVEDDDDSVWSVQVNASSQGEEIGEVGDCEHVEEEVAEVEDEWEDGGLIDELCEGLKKVSVQEKGGMPEYRGRHTRFIYNSDDEIEGEEEIGVGSSVSQSILCLKGMPMPEGKHLRFSEEEEE